MSADFTPEKEDYKILTPFKMQVLTNFPYIEADFDALTNYQLLCKVVEYLNNVITNENEVTQQVTSLYNAYVSLQNYVNNYFDNLDITGEVSAKLDEMANDGTLTNLISQYVDPIYTAYEEEINTDISNYKRSINNIVSNQNIEIATFKSTINSEVQTIDNKVNSATSGSPAGVYATVAALTSADPNHSKIYLVSEDGKWYYYNTSTTSWTAGGTYQATEVSDTDPTIAYILDNIEDLQNAKNDTIDTVYVTDPNFRSNNMTSSSDWHNESYRDPTTGELSQSQYTTGYCCSDFYAVKEGYKYEFKTSLPNYGTATLVLFDNTKTNGTTYSLGYLNADTPAIEYTIPEGISYISINISSNGSSIISNIYRRTQEDYEKDFSLPRLINKSLTDIKIVNFGDSIFGNGYGNNAVSNYIANATNATVYNCAFGGCRMGYHTNPLYDPFSMYQLAHAINTNNWTLQDTAILDESLPDYFPTSLSTLEGIDFTNIDIVTISYGTNDFADGLLPYGTETAIPRKFYYYNQALEYSINELLTAYPNLRIFVITPFYRFWSNGGTFIDDSNTHEVISWIDNQPHKLTEWVEVARDICKDYQLPLIDSYYNIGFNKLNRSVYYADGVHQNTTGRKLIADYIVHELY